MSLPPGVTEDMLIAAVERSMLDDELVGFCTSCGAEASGCEPDAEGYYCEECGEHAVTGAETLLVEISG